MLEQETIKKSLYNIYGLIYSYQSALKQKIEQEETDYSNIKSHYNYTEKSKLDFEISIYNNIEKKYYPFTQIFDL